MRSFKKNSITSPNPQVYQHTRIALTHSALPPVPEAHPAPLPCSPVWGQQSPNFLFLSSPSSSPFSLEHPFFSLCCSIPLSTQTFRNISHFLQHSLLTHISVQRPITHFSPAFHYSKLLMRAVQTNGLHLHVLLPPHSPSNPTRLSPSSLPKSTSSSPKTSSVSSGSSCYLRLSMICLTSSFSWDITLLVLVLCWFQSPGRPLRTEYLRLCLHHSPQHLIQWFSIYTMAAPKYPQPTALPSAQKHSSNCPRHLPTQMSSRHLNIEMAKILLFPQRGLSCSPPRL